MQSGKQLYEEGKYREAENIFKQVYSKDLNNSDALHMLGLIAFQNDNYPSAIKYLERAIELNPNSFNFYNSLGRVFLATGQIQQALTEFLKSINLEPGFAIAYYNAGVALHNLKDFAKACDYFNLSLEIEPNESDVYNALGNTLRELKEFDQAIESYKKALTIDPASPEFHYNIGVLLLERHQYLGAETHLEFCYSVDPQDLQLLKQLAIAYEEQGKSEAAEHIVELGLRQSPNDPDLLYRQACLLRLSGKIDDAIAVLLRAQELSLESADVCNGIAILLGLQGQAEEAISYFQQAVSLANDSPFAHSNLLYFLHYPSNYKLENIFDSHVDWARQFADSKKSMSLQIERQAKSRLRVGYFSPDFRKHPVAFFIEPLLRNHDRTAFEIYCYAEVPHADQVTKKIQDYADCFRFIHMMPTSQVAKQIAADRIDILIDLGGHTAGNRLEALAYRPAPVQVTYLGYPNTTGMSQIDYRITDEWADPVGASERFHTETLVRLPNGFLCYQPPLDTPDVQPPPVLKNKAITFGSFNNYVKIHPKQLALWAKILRAIPESRLVIKTPHILDTTARERTWNIFEENGVNRENVLLIQPMSSESYLSIYSLVDIALDSFPYNGTTTTCESLLMGVPVVTLAGESHVSRVGLSILGRLGLEELVAHDSEEYFNIAVEWSKDIDRLIAFRESIRYWMAMSSLCDGEVFTRDIENAYRWMWSNV